MSWTPALKVNTSKNEVPTIKALSIFAIPKNAKKPEPVAVPEAE